MSFKEVSKDGQPKNLYLHPREISEFIYRNLGVYLGFLSFQHNFQGLVDMLTHLKLLRTMEDEDIRMGYGMLVNEHTKKPIKTRLDREALNKLEQVWEKGGYLLTRLKQVNENFIDIEEEKYLYEYPEWELQEGFEEVTRMPSLFGLKSKDEVSSEVFLMRINEGVLEREAYRNQDPVQLCANGKLEYEKDGVLIPFFKTYADIENSTFFTEEVPRLYHDTMTSIAWRESLIWLNRLHVNIWKIGMELEAMDFMSPSKQTVKTKRIEEA